MSDPWLIQDTKKYIEEEVSVQEENEVANINSEAASLEFEDNFTSTSTKTFDSNNYSARSNRNEHQPLPDSDSYLRGLERKLEKIKKDSKLVEALKEKRQDCLRTLLQEDLSLSNQNYDLLELDTPIASEDSTVQEIYRHLQPVQPITIGETVTIVNYDQLEEKDADEPASR